MPTFDRRPFSRLWPLLVRVVCLVPLCWSSPLLAGSITGWGFNNLGQRSGTPSGSDFSQVVTGGYHNYARRSDGTIEAWGWDISNQVSATPADPAIVSYSAGERHGYARRTDGALQAWGSDSHGQVSATPTDTGFLAVVGGG